MYAPRQKSTICAKNVRFVPKMYNLCQKCTVCAKNVPFAGKKKEPFEPENVWCVPKMHGSWQKRYGLCQKLRFVPNVSDFCHKDRACVKNGWFGPQVYGLYPKCMVCRKKVRLMPNCLFFAQMHHWRRKCTTKQPKQQQFQGFQGAHGPGHMGIVATACVPMGAQVPALSPNDHPSPSQGQHKGFGKSRSFANVQPAHASVKTAKSSPPRAQGGGGGGQGYGPMAPAIGEGVHAQEKELFRAQV